MKTKAKKRLKIHRNNSIESNFPFMTTIYINLLKKTGQLFMESTISIIFVLIFHYFCSSITRIK